MMNQEIKRRIDNARNVLVGKVPDPKSQVEQITTALIYKFMDDMDKQSVSIGGKPSFFVGDYEKYSWTKLMNPALGGQARLSLYSEAIESFSQNPNIPQLFRDIFKDSYLPYRDPETLNLFLKEIDNFSYGSTDNIGDAYEYLLSVLGSQGDAGQFLTPRHIIKFIALVVDPKKNETVLDPACGTAGFLILSYLHILQANTDKKPGDLLTPDDKKRLSDNFVGYDIDPGMVRISRVNMYLHGFQLPYIYEYDTLTDERKWQEQFDVIMANPPFMTPKGGIRPHKLFSIHANRSEVLFVDYIAEHLNINGKSGVIVPEGIIFQSANAYKNLRKMLLDNYLWAVVSLPAGVFQPYSGVKTSILFMDKRLAKHTDNILFVKIENDGFGLGAQRREIDKNDLPLANEIMSFYKETTKQSRNVELPEEYKKLAHIVPKQKIIDSGDYNLTGDRYKEVINFANQKWPMVKLGDVCEIYNGSTPLRSNKQYWEDGDIPWFTIDDIREQGRVIARTKQKVTKKALEETSLKLLPKNTILLCCTASIGEYAISKIQLTTNQQFNGLIVKDNYRDNLIPEFLFWISSSFKDELIRLSGKTSFNFVSVGTLKQILIPLPPLEVQKQIVEEIESYQKIIDGARQIVENWKPTIKIDPNWPMVILGEVCEVLDSRRIPIKEGDRKHGPYPYYGASGILDYVDNYIFDEKLVLIGEDGAKWSSGENTAFIADGKYWVNNHAHVIKPIRSKILDEFIVFVLNQADLSQFTTGVTVPKLTQEKLRSINIPLSPLEVQKQIVSQIEEEQKTVDACKRLIEINEGKIKSKISEVWGE